MRPHKNQELLVRAACRSCPTTSWSCSPASPSRTTASCARLAGGLGVAERVSRSPDYVPDAELEALWGMAGCLAFPTRGEGFGLPVLEAMQRGVPVACSDIPVLREVGGELPRFFDPDDPADAAAARSSAALGLPATRCRAPASGRRGSPGRRGRRAPGTSTTACWPLMLHVGPEPRLPDPGRDRRDGDGGARD